MGKVTSLYGKTTGKIGSIVFSTSGGETIAREYNPHVANPSTIDQVNQRARMKLMSQMSASLAPSLAMRKDGLVSARNKFVKRNFDSSYAVNGTAQVTYENMQLTEGNLGLPQIGIEKNTSGDTPLLSIFLTDAPSANIARVVYNIYTKSQEGKLSYHTSTICETRGDGADNYYFLTENIPVPNGDLVVYAYGMIDTSERATAHYGELNVVDGQDIAKLIATRKIDFTDYQFTQTRGTTLYSNETETTAVPAGKARVFVTATNGGSVSGAGTFDIGSTVTVTATPSAGYVFSGWVNNGTQQIVSSSATYAFTLNGQVDLVATFYYQGNDSL